MLRYLPLLWCTFAATLCKSWCLTAFIELYARRLDGRLLGLNLLLLLLVSLGCVLAIPSLGIYGIPLATGLSYVATALLMRRSLATARAYGSVHGG